MDSDLSLDFLRVVEHAAIACAHTMGQGDRHNSDHVAVEAMRQAMDIAVDPLEGTNLCATGAPNAIAVLAAASRGGLLHAPDLYMEKLVVGPSSKETVSLDATPAENLAAIAKS